jgi:RND family efflux transporter MFP subunit
MWFWRVVLPGLGVAASLAVLWQAFGSSPGAGTSDDRREVAPSRSSEVSSRVVAEGRVVASPGALVTLGADAGGVVANLPASEKARVRRGDLLVVFRSEDQEAALAEAEAKLAEADAELVFQRRDFGRRVRDAVKGERFEAEIDAARRDHDVAAARRRAAFAAVAQARAALARTRIASPIDGVVTECTIQPGETVTPGTRLVTVCNLSRTRIEAEIDEFDVPRITVGSEVTITAEGYGYSSWRGTVADIPDRVSDRSIVPSDPGRPTDARVLLVKIAIVQPNPLKLGQTVEVAIHPPPSPPSPTTTSATKSAGP